MDSSACELVVSPKSRHCKFSSIATLCAFWCHRTLTKRAPSSSGWFQWCQFGLQGDLSEDDGDSSCYDLRDLLACEGGFVPTAALHGHLFLNRSVLPKTLSRWGWRRVHDVMLTTAGTKVDGEKVDAVGHVDMGRQQGRRHQGRGVSRERRHRGRVRLGSAR